MQSALTGWELARAPANAFSRPQELDAGLNWCPARVPGTAAASWHADLEAALAAPLDYDADDWWYRCNFTLPEGAPQSPCWRLRFEGLATLAEVWLNGEKILVSRNMFREQRLDVTKLIQGRNTLTIAFRSLSAALAEKRKRPRWKTALVSEQNLRWFRTTLLGRIPSWTPPLAPVGPWRPITLEATTGANLEIRDLQSRAEKGAGLVKLKAVISGADESITAARLRVGEETYPLSVTSGRQAHITGDINIPNVPLWWPHTHGQPALLPAMLEIKLGSEWLRHDCGPLGFKHIEWQQDNDATRFLVNGEPVFCRGACWMPVDALGLSADPKQLRAALETARAAGMNMLRVGGTTVYESDEFYRLCDELGILVWQDLMFANMDYPVADEAFRAECEAELDQQLERLQRHACVATYCGGSEVAQQAAMLGLPAAEWLNGFFAESAPRQCAGRHAGIPWFASTPWGGALPFHVGTGIAHYYGVGAYLRPLSDARAARVKFSTECLGFSNLPDAEAMEALFDGHAPPPHHPLWKARVPRDNGAGWDFEDVRDHYLKLLFGLDPVALRSTDVDRYRALSRVATGEVMRRVYAEWRRPGSGCGGALVWFYRDLWAGAGWGVTDCTGRRKPVLWYLARAWAPQSIHFTDEGLDGLALHAVNDVADALDAEVEFELFQHGRVRTGAARQTVTVPPRGGITLQGDALLGFFSDSSNAYRFGPPRQDVAVARLKRRSDGRVLSEDFHFPAGLSLPQQRAERVRCAAERLDSSVVLRLASDVFLQSVCVSAPGWEPDDNYFHVAPGTEKQLLFRPVDRGTSSFEATVQALNLPDGPGLSARVAK